MGSDKEDVMRRWNACQEAYSANYEDCRSDWEFLHGIGQWDAQSAAERAKNNIPTLTLNQLLPYAQQIVNDIRQSRMAIRVSPVDDESDVDTAEVLQGVIRNIERQSKADTAYSTASLNAVGAGIGWLLIRTDYADEDTFDQEIYIDRVLDFTSVYLDPAAEKLDGSDAEYAFIRRNYTKERFEELYPDAEITSFEGNVKKDDVCIVEHYYKYYKSDKLYSIQLIDGSTQIINKEQKAILDEDGTVIYEVLKERSVEVPHVKYCVYSGDEEPIEEKDFPSRYIPVVPVIGEEVFINDAREFHSLIRQARDAQAMYNFWKSSGTEFIKMQPKAPWIAPVGSFNSYPKKWANSNVENFSTLEYDVVFDENGQRVEPPQRQQPIQGSIAMMQEAMSAREDIRLAIGMPQANMGEGGGEISGVAIRNRQIEGDNATFHFVDNLAVAISQVGTILVDMIPNIYGDRKIMRILGEDGSEKTVPVNQPFVKEDGQIRAATKGETKIDGIHQLGVGKYDVVCDVGASYSSKRQETADKLIELVRAKPELADVTADLLFEALDIPMGKEIADRIRATMDPAILGEDPQANRLKEAAKAIQQLEEQVKNYDAALQDKKKNQQFEETVSKRKLELERQDLAIKKQKTLSDIEKTKAEIEKMRAETSGFNIEAVTVLGNAVSGLNEQVADIGAAMQIMFEAKESEMFDADELNEETSEPLPTDAQLTEREYE